MLTNKEIEFIVSNKNTDTSKLLLSNKDNSINISLCVKCIEARKKIEKKVPLWYGCNSLCYPLSLSIEQCSSQATAMYKKEIAQRLSQDLNTNNFVIADMTAGMGIDSYFLSQASTKHIYIERNIELCKAAEYNFKQLEAENIKVINQETLPNNTELFSMLKDENLSLIYIDPARRDKSNGKVVSIKDYEPNILELNDIFLSLAEYILVKVSPMEDIKLNLSLLPQTKEIHVISHNNECKELLFLMQRDYNANGNPLIKSVNINKNCSYTQFDFYLNQETQAASIYATNIQEYLYEPNKAVLKSGAYKLVGETFELEKLALSTHLYTSATLKKIFPGKCYKVEECIPFNKKSLKQIAGKYPYAALTARNFPIDTNELKKISGIKDGGEKHIFVVSLNNKQKYIIVCK